MRKYYTILFLFISLFAFSQNNGINFQGVGRNSTGAVLASQKISLRFSVIQGSETGTVEYVESKEVTTNAQGIFSVVIGDGTQISKTGNFTDINWKINPKFLRVEMDPAGGSSFAAMGTTRLQSVPFAYYANGVNADNVDGVLSASKGGTGVASITALKTALGIDQINNTSDLAKPISTATQTALDTKVSTATFSTTVAAKANVADLVLKAPIESPTFTGTVSGITKAMVGLSNVENTADLAKPISTATQAILDTKVSTATFSTTMATKANLADVALKAPLESPIFTGTVSGITKAMVGLSNVANTTDLAKPISTATQEALDTKVSVATFSTTMVTKENAANKSAAIDLGAGATSDILFPTQKAVKTYVDTQVNAGGVADGGILTRHLADGAVTDAKISTGINKSKVGLSNVENTAISTWTGSPNLLTVGTINSGIWSGTAIDYSKLDLNNKIVNGDIVDSTITMQKLGISKTDFTNFGLASDEDVIYYEAGMGLVGTTTVVPNGRRSGSAFISTTFSILGIDSSMIINGSVINSKIGDGEISTSKVANASITDSKIASGIDKNKVGLGNVENTPLSTWTGSSSLATLGTITSGTWSASVIELSKGGTGATNASTARANLGLEIGTNVQAPLVAGIDYLAPNGSAASLTNFPTFNQNTTGNAATATLAGNITATTNNTLTTLQNLSSVGTINTGVWSGTTISVSNGGTGSTSLTSNSVLLGNGLNALQTVAPGNYGNILVSNGSTWNSEPLSLISAGNLTGTTLASNVVISSLTRVGVLSNTTINGKLAVGTSAAVTSSAVLEASSTSQGFLPPRLNHYQKTQITNPVAGLTIWCSNCGDSGEMQVFNGSTWTNMIGGTATGTVNLSIGQSYQGGKIFYILVDGDPGYDPNTQHGFIVSLVDISSGIKWNGATIPYPQTGATGEALGTGYSNTNTIIAMQDGPATNYAAGIARAYRGGGYLDWYLPSKDELNKLYLNRSTVGGTWLSKYYTSTENSTYNNFAWFQDFSAFVGYSGVQNSYLKEYQQGVRAIRSF